MTWQTFCRFARVAASAFVLSLAHSQSAQSVDYKVLVKPPPQMNARSCQSYSLAVALALADASGRYPIKSSDDLQVLERTIRMAIELTMKLAGRTESTRDDWKRVIEQLSFGDFTVTGKQFAVYEDLVDFLDSQLAIKTKVGLPSLLTLTSPTTVYLASFTQLNGSQYRLGHIVSIFGQEHLRGNVGQRLPLLLINSAAKEEICAFPPFPQRYFGYSGWTSDYALKYLRLDWIEKRH